MAKAPFNNNNHGKLNISVFCTCWENLNKWHYRWGEQRCQIALTLDGFNHTLRSYYIH
jgi:hypothetical protein